MAIPSSFPSFGMTARESMRLNHMFRKDEPLIQEIFGLQVLFGMIGSFYHGLIGFVIGMAQFAPVASLVPGRVGGAFRAAGWHIFTAVMWLVAVGFEARRFALAQWTLAAGLRAALKRRLRRALKPPSADDATATAAEASDGAADKAGTDFDGGRRWRLIYI